MSNFVDLNDLDEALGQTGVRHYTTGGQAGPARVAGQTAQTVAEAEAARQRRAQAATVAARGQTFSVTRDRVATVAPVSAAQAQAATVAARGQTIATPRTQVRTSTTEAQAQATEAARRGQTIRTTPTAARPYGPERQEQANEALARGQKIYYPPSVTADPSRRLDQGPAQPMWDQAASIAVQQAEWNRASAFPTTQARPIQASPPVGPVVWTSPNAAVSSTQPRPIPSTQPRLTPTPVQEAPEDAPDYLFHQAVAEANAQEAAEKHADAMRMRADSEAEQNAARRRRVDDELNAQAKARAERIRASQPPPAERGEWEQEVRNLAAKLENDDQAVKNQAADELKAANAAAQNERDLLSRLQPGFEPVFDFYSSNSAQTPTWSSARDALAPSGAPDTSPPAAVPASVGPITMKRWEYEPPAAVPASVGPITMKRWEYDPQRAVADPQAPNGTYDPSDPDQVTARNDQRLRESAGMKDLEARSAAPWAKLAIGVFAASAFYCYVKSKPKRR